MCFFLPVFSSYCFISKFLTIFYSAILISDIVTQFPLWASSVHVRFPLCTVLESRYIGGGVKHHLFSVINASLTCRKGSILQMLNFSAICLLAVFRLGAS